MKILIQRFTLRHNGEEYNPGDVLEVDDVIGARLLKAGRGTIREIKEAAPKTRKIKPKNETLQEQQEQQETEDMKEIEEDEPNGLPSADPAQAIKPGKASKTK